ncbi:MAG: peptidyl-prolyl cis-trans isomerase [Candidatus Omnitrophica bacterium]|nr:peptidyl-prolyl cis-trans isomerase [Candidatus Omnitrophota bacterium]
MKSNLKKIFSGLFLTTILLLSSQAFAVQDTIIAIVNDDVITMRELDDYLHAVHAQLAWEGRSEEEIKKIMKELEVNGINKLIEDKLIVTEADRIGLQVNEKVVEERLEEIKKQYPSEQKFYQALIDDGATVTDLRNKIKDQLKIKFLIDDKVKAKIYIHPQDVTAYYNSHLEGYQKPEQLELDSIYLSRPENPEEAQRKIEKAYQILSKLQKKESSFQDLAKEYSEAPSIGMVERGKLLPQIEEAVFKLKEGEVSSVVEVEGGFFIFYLKKKEPASVAQLSEVKEQISQRLFQEKFKEGVREWIDKLKKKAFIEVKTDAPPGAS